MQISAWPSANADALDIVFIDIHLGDTAAEGMGLGLWLAKYIIERHGGTLELDQTHQPGARFVLRLTLN